MTIKNYKNLLLLFLTVVCFCMMQPEAHSETMYTWNIQNPDIFSVSDSNDADIRIDDFEGILTTSIIEIVYASTIFSSSISIPLNGEPCVHEGCVVENTQGSRVEIKHEIKDILGDTIDEDEVTAMRMILIGEDGLDLTGSRIRWEWKEIFANPEITTTNPSGTPSAPVPEPSTIFLFGVALSMLAFWRKRINQ